VALRAQQSGAMGEGWSDFFAISYGGDDVIGEYSTGNAASGIRKVAYTAGNGREFGQFGNIFGPFAASDGQLFVPEVHNDGEIWASLLADVRRTLTAAPAGLSAAQVEQLVTEALFFTPASPNMTDARDALLLADALLNGGANTCALWTVFKGRGLGYNAANNEIGPAFRGAENISVFASHDAPPACGGAFGRGSLKHQAQFDASPVGATRANGWQGSGLWHVSERRASTCCGSFYYGLESTGNYDTGATNFGSLVSPVLDLSTASHPVLEFDIWQSTQIAPFDTVWIRLSTDGGATYPIQRSILGQPTLNLATRLVEFRQVRIDLAPLAGTSTARIQFYFDTLDPVFNRDEGVYVDNIQVRDYVEN
jgi:hypothetical protein